MTQPPEKIAVAGCWRMAGEFLESPPAVTASVLVALYGTDEALAPEVALRAGPLSMTLRGGGLVDLKVAGREVWHGVAFVYRDADWGTPEPVFERMVHTAEGAGFSLQLEGLIPTQPPIDLLLTLRVDAHGTVTLQARAVPRGDLLANRIGLCLLHPLQAMGRSLEVEHVDGRISRSTFPELVPAWPPFTGVRGICHEFAPGHWAQARLLGDDFEFEDQRNNADASFKTYSRSNSMPRPYVLRGGVVIEQSLTLRIEGTTAVLAPAPIPARIVRLTKRAELARIPQLGLAIEPADVEVCPRVLAALAELSPALLHLTLAGPSEPVQWRGIARLLAASDARLRLDLAAGVTEASLARLAVALHDAGITPESVAVFPGTPPAVAAARQAFPASAIGGGTPHFFAQLNRLEDVGPADFLGFTVCPTVHGADDAAPMAGLQALFSLLGTARARHPVQGLRIGPSSLGARSSPLGKQPASDGTRRLALAQRDPRTRGLFGAAWLLGHVAQAARAGAEAVSVLSLRGAAGVLDDTLNGRLLHHPSFFVLAQLARLKHAQTVTVSNTAQVAALSGLYGDKARWLMANLTARAVDVTMDSGASVCVMDAAAWLAYASGQAISPWREFCAGQAGVVQLDAFAIASA